MIFNVSAFFFFWFQKLVSGLLAAYKFFQPENIVYNL